MKLHSIIKMDTIFMNSGNSETSEPHVLILKLTDIITNMDDKFELPDGWYSVWDIQDYFQYILKKHGENIDNPSINIYVNKMENRITFRIKKGYSIELLTSETMKPLGSTENKITKDKNDENVPHLEITEVVLVHCNIVNNDYQQYSRDLYTFVSNKPFGSLFEISPTNHIFLRTFNSEFQTI